MKLAKKVLSFALAFLMAFGTFSICAPNLAPLEAEAASIYTVPQVQSLVSAAASAAATQSSSGNAWNYSGDNGAVLAAAEAIYDYAVNGVKGSGSTAANNSSDALYDTVRSNLGYAEGSNEAKLIKSILYPDGTTTYKYNGLSKSGNWEDQSSKNNGADLTNDSNVTYAAVTDSVTKTAAVTLDVNAYLLTINGVENIPASFPTKVTYSFINTNGKSASQTSQTSRTEGMLIWKKTYYTHYWTSYKWNYLSTVNRTVEATNTTAAADLQGYAAYFTAERLATSAADMLTWEAEEVDALLTEIEGKVASMGGYSYEILDHFLGMEAIEAYIAEVKFAGEVVRAQANMKILLDAMKAGYDKENRSEMESLYTKVSTAYDTIKDYEEEIFDYVVANNSDFKDFTLESAKAFIDTLYFDIEVTYVKEIKASIDAEITAGEPLVADPENKDDITDIELAAIIDRLNGYNNSLKPYSKAAQEAVFTEGTDYITTFRTAVQFKIDTRAAQVEYEPFYVHFLPLIYASPAFWSVSEMHDRYEEDSEKVASLNASYTKWVPILGTTATSVFSFYYNGEKVFIITAVEDYLARLKQTIIDKVDAQIEEVKFYAEAGSEVNFNNFSGLKAALDNFNEPAYYVQVGTDAETGEPIMEGRNLYTYAHNVKGWIPAASFDVNALLDAYNAFVASGGLPFTQKHYHDDNGVFVTRYAGDQGEDAEGNQIGYPNDIARDGAAENYVVDESKVTGVITKLDQFITSEEFCDLVGLNDLTEGETNYANLSEAIEGLIHDKLFTNEMMNTIVAALFPMLCDMINDLLSDLGSLGMDGIVASSDPDSIGTLDLGVLASSMASGKLNAYANTKRGTISFAKATEALKLYIFPSSFAQKLGNYPTIKNALTAADTDWHRFDKEVDGEIKTVLDFDWGITDYNTFAAALGCVIDSILPLVQALLLGSDYSETANNMVYAENVDNCSIKVDDVPLVGSITLNVTALEASANITIIIGGQTLYKDLLIPIFEAVGLLEHDFVFNIPASSANGTTITKAILDPVLELIDELASQPINKVLEVLPNLMYALSMDKVADLINSINPPIELKLDINDIQKLEAIKIFGYSPDISSIGNNFKGTINDALEAFPIDLDVASLLKLQELLGFDYRNINALVTYVLDMLDVGLEVPTINAGEIILCSNGVNDAFSYRTGGKRIQLTADKADILFLILRYVCKAIGTEGFVDELIYMIQNSDLAEGEVPEAVELPGIVNNIIHNLHNNPLNGLAALVELFEPQTYSTQAFDWVQSQYDYAGIEGMNDASIIYLTYGNDWQKSDATYLVENIDAIAASILEMTGSEVTSVSELLKTAINGLLTNANITSIVKTMVSLGSLLGDDETIADLLYNATGVNLTAASDAFGYLFVTEEDKAAEGFIAPLAPGDEGYENTYNMTGVASVNEKGETVVTWSYDGTELVDGAGDYEIFADLLCESIKEFAPLLATIFCGKDLEIFDGAIEFKGYESYAGTVGMLFELLGIKEVMTQAQYEAFCEDEGDVAALIHIVDQLFAWIFDDLLADPVQKILEILSKLIYLIESNGISTILHNILMPIWVIIDTIRPIVDINLDAVLSLLVSDLVNYGEIDTDVLLQFISGVYVNDDLEYKWFDIHLTDLRLTDILKLLDVYMGTSLADSQLVNPGLMGLCSGVIEQTDSVVGTSYTTEMDAADTVTILLSAVIEALEYKCKDGETNGEKIVALVEDKLGEDSDVDVSAIYNAVIGLLHGVDVSYETPDWFYMGNVNVGSDKKVTLPAHTITYLSYSNDWTESTAMAVEDALNEIVELVLDSAADGQTIAQLLNGILEDKVYSDANLTLIVEGVANLIGALDATLRKVVDTVLDTDIASWFDMCKPVVNEETGKTEFVCTKDWGVDAADAADKKAVFIAGLKEVLAPANQLLAFLLFGDSYEFFTSSEKNEDGSYKYNSIITLTGGQGYNYTLVPILEALGLTLKPASAYLNAETGKYNTVQAVEDILNSVFALIDELSGNPATEAFDLIVNLIYFINADGLGTSVANLLTPFDELVSTLLPLFGENMTLGELIAGELGFDISDLSMVTLLGMLANEGFTMSEGMIALLLNFYVGELTQFDSANGNVAYRMTFTEEEDYHDMLTIVLSIALEVFECNAEIFSELLGADTYTAIITLLGGAQEGDLTYIDPNWAYMYDGEDALAQLAANGFPARTPENEEIYISYANNWNKETADYLNDNLATIIKGITDAVRSDGKYVGTLLDDAITKGLYKNSVLNSLMEALVGLIAEIDYVIVKTVGNVLDVDVDTLFGFCTITRDETTGEVLDVTCSKDWGIDSKTTNAEKKEAFVNAFVTALEPANRLLAWLLFEEEYTFFLDSESNDIITLSGGKGYAEAFVPLLEALGCEMKPVSAYYTTGELDMSAAVRDVFTALTDWLYDICGDIAALDTDATKEDAIEAMLGKLINVVYFINADGLKAVVNNLLEPINFIIETLAPLNLSVDFDDLITLGDGYTLPLTQIDFYEIFNIVEATVPLYFPDDVQDFVANVFLGAAEAFTSANGKTAYRMVYTEEESRRDMITILLSMILESAQDERNEGKLSDWLGDDVYDAIMAMLALTEAKDMEEFKWYYTEYADTDKVLSPIQTSKMYYATYNRFWTRDKAQYIADNIQDFIDDLICLLGLEIEGIRTDSLESLLDVVISENLYTQANADAILNAIRDVVSQLTTMEPYGEWIVEVLKRMLGVDLLAWETMTVTVTEGDSASFADALTQIIMPAAPLLKVLLCGEDIRLFFELDGVDTIIIPGSEGYAYGIIPLLEALHCEDADVLTPDEYKASIEENPENAVRNIINPLFNRIAAIEANPADEIFDMLPAVIYFINSKGLDTCLRNLVNTVDTVLEALSPIVGETTLLDMLGVDLSTIDFTFLFNELFGMLEDMTGDIGLSLGSLGTDAFDAIAELTTGKVVTYESKNGETYYTMRYTTGYNKADMVTVVLRLAFTLITIDDNVTLIKNLLADYITDEETYKYVCTLLDSIVRFAKEDPGMGKVLYTVYYLFYAMNNVVQDQDDAYHEVNDNWEFFFDLLGNSSDPTLNGIGNDITDILNKYLNDIVDGDGVAPEGGIKFFENLIALFKKIIEFFKNLFSSGII